jgi:hypothetical protein
MYNTAMGIFNKSFSKKKFAVFDIGSASVTGSLVEIDKRGEIFIPKIVFTHNEQIPFKNELHFDHFLSDMLKALTQTSDALLKSGIGSPDEIHCFLASPWYGLQMRTSQIEKNTEFVITEKILKELVDREISIFEKEQLSRYHDAGEIAELIEKDILSVSLNGYKTDKPIGKRTKYFSVSMVLGMSPKLISESIREVMRKGFHRNKVHFHTFVYTASIVVRDLFLSHDSFLLVDIGGEITDVAIVKNGVLQEAISFPYGKNSIIRRIAGARKISHPEALSLLVLSEEGTLEEGTHDELKKTIEEIRGKWISAFEKSLSHIATEFLLPDVVALTADDDMASFFEKSVSSETFIQYTLTERPFRIVTIDNKSLAPFVEINMIRDINPFILLNSLFISRKLKK